MNSSDPKTDLDVIRACVVDVLAQAEAARRVAERVRTLLSGDAMARPSELRAALASLRTCIAELHETAAYAHTQATDWVQRFDFQSS